MKLHFLSIVFFVTISFSLFSEKAHAKNNTAFTDTTCCAPDSLKVISRNFPVFCVGWKVSTDSNCIQPYGFEIEWAAFPGGLWTTRTIIYTGGPWVTFCDSVPECRTYQWRVRTICISAGGIISHSNWIAGPKIAMICSAKTSDRSKNDPSPVKNKPVIIGKVEY